MSDIFGIEISRPFGTERACGCSYPTLKGWAIVVTPFGRTLRGPMLASRPGCLDVSAAYPVGNQRLPELKIPLKGARNRFDNSANSDERRHESIPRARCSPAGRAGQ